MKQQIFHFEERHDYLPENFLTSGCNRAAFDAAQDFDYALNIYGPASCGKTYLAHISGAKHVVENVDESADEKELLHLLNSAREHGERVFITSARPLAEIGFKLPDLKSRLGAINSVGIEAPDDALVYLLFARHFAAKQLKVSDEVINYLAARSARSFEELANIARKIDRLSLAEKKNISINLVKKLYG